MEIKHIEKLELRVEKLDDKVDAIKEDIFELKGDVKAYAQEVRFHVAGDKKIITEILPTINAMSMILPELQRMSKENESRRVVDELREVKKAKLKSELTLVGVTISIATACYGVVKTLFFH